MLTNTQEERDDDAVSADVEEDNTVMLWITGHV